MHSNLACSGSSLSEPKLSDKLKKQSLINNGVNKYYTSFFVFEANSLICHLKNDQETCHKLAGNDFQGGLDGQKLVMFQFLQQGPAYNKEGPDPNKGYNQQKVKI